MTPEQLRELANHAKRCCQWADPPDPQKYLDIAAALRELADIKDAAGRGVTAAVINAAVLAWNEEYRVKQAKQLDSSVLTRLTAVCKAVAPMLAVQQWGPIESVPQGVVVALLNVNHYRSDDVLGQHKDIGYLTGGGWFSTFGEMRAQSREAFTHWCALPAPPATAPAPATATAPAATATATASAATATAPAETNMDSIEKIIAELREGTKILYCTRLADRVEALLRDNVVVPREPVAWQFQHEETGRMIELSNDGINNPDNFVVNNPRFQYVGPLYGPAPQSKE